MLRSALLGVAVFTVAALAGMALATAAPANLISEPTPAESVAISAAPGASPAPPAGDPIAASQTTFARSMIYSGVIALAVSITGTVLVMRRRRHW